MNQKLLFIFTRTPLHIGAGSSVGAIDQPVQRERHTGFPIIPGSSIKGVLRDLFRRDEQLCAQEEALFGKQEEAGRIAFSEAKLLAFPVRSAKGSFAWITCPLALERFRREYNALAQTATPPEPHEMHCLAGETVTLKNGSETGVVLEEYRFQPDGSFPEAWEKELLNMFEDGVWKTGKGRWVLLSNGDFSHFAKTACEVSQHVGINPLTGTAKPGALFNIEAVPSETLFFASLTALPRSDNELEILQRSVTHKILQFGGDNTTGMGFCAVHIV